MTDYDQIRQTARDGDLIFLTVDEDNWLSRITAWVTASPYTHVAFLFWYKQRLMLIESTTTGGIRIVQASVYHDRPIKLIHGPRLWDDIEDRALSRSGTAEYGWLSAAYIGLREFLFTHFNLALPQNKHNRNKACSEFVAEILELDDVDISPGQLFRLLERQNAST
jgi:hypothetical protein